MLCHVTSSVHLILITYDHPDHVHIIIDHSAVLILLGFLLAVWTHDSVVQVPLHVDTKYTATIAIALASEHLVSELALPDQMGDDIHIFTFHIYSWPGPLECCTLVCHLD